MQEWGEKRGGTEGNRVDVCACVHACVCGGAGGVAGE